MQHLSEIHNLAIHTVESIQEAYKTRWSTSDNADSCIQLKKLLENSSDDQTIVSVFELYLQQAIKNSGPNQYKSIFIIQTRGFIAQAKLLIRIKELESTNTKLELSNQKFKSHFNQDSAIAHNSKSKLGSLPAEILCHLFLFLDDKDLAKMCFVFNLSNTVITEKIVNPTIFKPDPVLHHHKFFWYKRRANAHIGQTSMQVFLNDIDGTHRTLNLFPKETIDSLRTIHEYKNGKYKNDVTAHNIIFICGGKQLKDGKTLEDYKIQKESTIHATFRLCGD